MEWLQTVQSLIVTLFLTVKEWVVCAEQYLPSADLIKTLAAVVGICLAWCGLRTWQRQLKGSTEYELARRFLRAAYKLESCIEALRDPAPYQGEDPQSSSAQPSSTSFGNQGNESLIRIHERRWDKVEEARIEFLTEWHEARILWPGKFEEAAWPLLECVNTLNLNIYWYIRTLREPRYKEYFEKQGEMKKIMSTVARSLAVRSGEDEFSRQLMSAIKKLDDCLRPYLLSKIK